MDYLSVSGCKGNMPRGGRTGDCAELVLATLGVAAKLKRQRILECTARGRADASKAKGVKSGRKPKLTPHRFRGSEYDET